MGLAGFFLAAECSFGRGGREPSRWFAKTLCIFPPFSPLLQNPHEKQKTPFGVLFDFHGGIGGVRTRDLGLKRALLYQLSYNPKERLRKIASFLVGGIVGKVTELSNLFSNFTSCLLAKIKNEEYKNFQALQSMHFLLFLWLHLSVKFGSRFLANTYKYDTMLKVDISLCSCLHSPQKIDSKNGFLLCSFFWFSRPKLFKFHFRLQKFLQLEVMRQISYPFLYLPRRILELLKHVLSDTPMIFKQHLPILESLL